MGLLGRVVESRYLHAYRMEIQLANAFYIEGFEGRGYLIMWSRKAETTTYR